MYKKWWVRKNYYPSNKLNSLSDNGTYKIIYYCNNHLLNTKDKNYKFKNNKSLGKIEIL